MKRYNIGDICFSWESEEYILETGKYSEQFRIEIANDMEEIRFKAYLKDLTAYNGYKRIFENYSYEIVDVDNERLLIYHWAHCKLAFAIWPDRIDADKENVCYLNPELFNNVTMEEDWFYGLTGLHKALLQKDAPIVHASYIDYEGQAILFAAPSGTGKTTQAKLWEMYAGAKIINGDRVLLRKKNNTWHAYGYPCCGSSDICVNRTLPIKTIVFLKQGEENFISELSITDRIRGLASGFEVYNWDINEIDKALELATDIVGNVKVIELTCRPNQEAVELLKGYLQEGVCR